MKKWFLKNFTWFLPVVFMVVITIPLLVWLKIDTNLPHWDMGRHLYTTIQYRTLWEEFFEGRKSIFGVFGFYGYYPLIVHNLALPFYWLFGTNQDSAVYSNIVWLFILLFSVFNISNKLWGIKSGYIAMLVLLSSPIIIGQMREFQVDLPLTAIVSLSLYLLLKTENFSNKKYSILIGIVAGIGMMVKWTYLAYAGPAIGLFLILGLLDKKNRKIVVQNVIIAFFITIAICGYWYIRNFEPLKHDFSTNGIGVAKLEGDPTGFTKMAFTWYLKNMNRYYLYLPLALLFVISFVHSTVINKNHFKKIWPIVLLIFVYYFIFSALPNKDIRYVMPIMTLIAITISSLATISQKKVYRIMLFLVVVSVFVLNNAAVAFGNYWGVKNKEKILFKNTNYSYYGILLSDIGGYTSGSPRQKICPLEEMISQIPENKSAKLLGEDSMFVNDWATGFILTKEGKIFSRDLPDSDYLLFRDGPSWPNSIDNMQARDKVTIIDTVNCADGYNIYLTKVNK